MKALRAGGVDYITKPFHIEEVLARVSTHVAMRQMQRQIQEQNAELKAKNAQLQREMRERQQTEVALAEQRSFFAFFRQVIDINPNLIFARDREGRFTLVNQTMADFYGTTVEELLGKRDADVNPNATYVATVQREDLELMEQAEPQIATEKAITHASGEQRWLSVIKRPIRDPDGTTRQVLGVGVDITERKQTEAALRQRVQQLDALRDTLAELTQISSDLDLDTLLHSILKRAVALLGATAGELSLYDARYNDLHLQVSYNMGRDNTGMRQAIGEGAAGQVAATQKPLIIDDYSLWGGHLPGYEASETRAVLLVPLLAGDRLIGVIGVATNNRQRRFGHADEELLTLFAQQATIAIENARLFGEARHLATTDPLLGIHNRRHFFVLAEREFALCHEAGLPISVVMIDIDNFKKVNDIYGHASGDQALQLVARHCLAHVRDRDVVGRYGGEEIVLLLPNTERLSAWQVAEHLRRQVAQAPIAIDRGTLFLTASFGVSTWSSEQEMDLDRLIDCADQALYVAKHSGKNRVVSWGGGGEVPTMLAPLPVSRLSESP